MKEREDGRVRNSLLKSTIWVSVIVIIGKFLGFGREALIAAYYGASAETDAFFFAQNMPGMLFPSVCNSVSTVFISLYVSRIVEDGEKRADQYASRMLLVTSFLGTILSALGVVLAPIFVPLLAPGFGAQQCILAIRLTRLTMGAFLLTMLQYMLSAILNSKKMFIGSQIAGLLYNITVIFVTFFIGRGQGVDALTYTVILGHLAQIVALCVCLRGHIDISFSDSGNLIQESKVLLKLALPVLLGNAAVQLNTIADQALGSLLPEGSLSALSYANTLTYLVTSIFIASLSTVLYPALASEQASGNLEQYGQYLSNSLIGLEFVLVPISGITLVCAKDIVQVVYARGSFDQSAVAYTALALQGYALMFIGVGIRELLNRAFYAQGNTKTPMWNTAIGVVCNVICSICLIRRLGVAGIAVGTTVSSAVTAFLLMQNAKKQLGLDFALVFLEHFKKQLLAGVLSIGVLFLINKNIPIERPLVRFAVSVVAGGGLYGGLLLCIDRIWIMGLLRQVYSRKK